MSLTETLHVQAALRAERLRADKATAELDAERLRTWELETKLVAAGMHFRAAQAEVVALKGQIAATHEALDRIACECTKTAPSYSMDRLAAELRTKPMKKKLEFQYYYRTALCKASQASEKDCVCWHDEGTGPYKDERHTSETPLVYWRIKP